MMRSPLLTDLRLYWRLASMQIRSQLQYRVSTGVEIGTYFLVTALEFTQVFLLFATFSTLGGWNKGEVALLYAVTSICFGLAELFGAGFDAFADLVRQGNFDRVLVRPASPLVQVASSDFRVRRLGRISQGALSFAVAWWLLHGIEWTPAKALALATGFASGGLIFVAIFMLEATICFWSIESTELTNILTYGGREMLSWPLTIYNELMQRVFLFCIPLAFGAFVPVCFILGKPLPFSLPGWVVFLGPLLALVGAALSL
ncbi:MAG TPA: ABC-2 family transporter protein, partial [Ktedonobacterales bacterium]